VVVRETNEATLPVREALCGSGGDPKDSAERVITTARAILGAAGLATSPDPTREPVAA